MCYSAQNIDRLVTMFKAAKKSRRNLVLDLYAATMTRATGNTRIPQADWDDALVYVPLSQRIRVKTSGEFERTAAVREHRVFPSNYAGQAGSLVMTFRGSMARELERAGCLDQAHCVWSLWWRCSSSTWFGSSVLDRGIVLAGGGALLQGLDERLRHETHMPVHLAESPLTCVAVGSGRSLEEFDAIHRSARARGRNGRSRH